MEKSWGAGWETLENKIISTDLVIIASALFSAHLHLGEGYMAFLTLGQKSKSQLLPHPNLQPDTADGL